MNHKKRASPFYLMGRSGQRYKLFSYDFSLLSLLVLSVHHVLYGCSTIFKQKSTRKSHKKPKQREEEGESE